MTRILTSYYACRHLPDNAFLVQVSATKPKGFIADFTWTDVMPDYMSLVRLHNAGLLDTAQYAEQYTAKLDAVLSQISLMLHRIKILASERDIVLLCWCRPSAFYHRHILAHWLNKHFDAHIVEWQPESNCCTISLF